MVALCHCQCRPCPGKSAGSLIDYFILPVFVCIRLTVAQQLKTLQELSIHLPKIARDPGTGLRALTTSVSVSMDIGTHVPMGIEDVFKILQPFMDSVSSELVSQSSSDGTTVFSLIQTKVAAVAHTI